MYPNLNANSIYTEVKDKDNTGGPSIDDMIPEFTLDADTVSIKFFTRLDDVAYCVDKDKLEVFGLCGRQKQHLRIPESQSTSV